MNAPPRGFPDAEFDARLARAQAGMARAGLAALLFNTEPEIRYFTGFLTRFWESPSRPWFLILPAAGLPIAVIPAIGAALMRTARVGEIRTWPAPRPEDDGLSLLAETLREVTGGSGEIGMPMGPETTLRLPLAEYRRLEHLLAPLRIVHDSGLAAGLRAIKSEAEIAKIATACRIAGRAFDRVPEIAAPGVPLSTVFRRFQMLCLEEGADWVPYLAGGAGPGGYPDVISPASDTPLAKGDILMLDTGAVWDGYFCDYDRNYAVGAPDAAARDAHARLIEATTAGLDAARPGATAATLFDAMDRVLTGGRRVAEAGRLGHGLGMQLTEGCSLLPQDRTVLEPGMVLTLEPGIEAAPGRLLVHEENIVIRDGGADRLSCFAGPDLPVLGDGA